MTIVCHFLVSVIIILLLILLLVVQQSETVEEEGRHHTYFLVAGIQFASKCDVKITTSSLDEEFKRKGLDLIGAKETVIGSSAASQRQSLWATKWVLLFRAWIFSWSGQSRRRRFGFVFR